MVCVYRKEIKYVIPREVFGRLQRLLDAVLERDPHHLTNHNTANARYRDPFCNANLSQIGRASCRERV